MGRNDDDEDDEGPLSQPFFAENSEFPEAMARMKAGWEEMQAAKAKDPNRLDPETRKLLKTALAQLESGADAVRSLLKDGWPPADEDLPVVSNWQVEKKSRLPCLEGNIFGTEERATIRSCTPPLIHHDTARGLAVTAGGLFRTQQPLIPKPEKD